MKMTYQKLIDVTVTLMLVYVCWPYTYMFMCSYISKYFYTICAFVLPSHLSYSYLFYSFCKAINVNCESTFSFLFIQRTTYNKANTDILCLLSIGYNKYLLNSFPGKNNMYLSYLYALISPGRCLLICSYSLYLEILYLLLRYNFISNIRITHLHCEILLLFSFLPNSLTIIIINDN